MDLLYFEELYNPYIRVLVFSFFLYHQKKSYEKKTAL